MIFDNPYEEDGKYYSTHLVGGVLVEEATSLTELIKLLKEQNLQLTNNFISIKVSISGNMILLYGIREISIE